MHRTLSITLRHLKILVRAIGGKPTPITPRLPPSRFAVLTPLYPPATSGGGPIRTLDALVRAAPQYATMAVVAGDRDVGSIRPLPVVRNEWTSHGRTLQYYVTAEDPRKFVRSLDAIRRWKPDVLYINGFFSAQFSVLPLTLRRFGWCHNATVLIAPRGELSRGALVLKPWRKRAYIALQRHSGVLKDAVWHASSAAEADEIVQIFGTRTSVLVRENETSLPPRALLPAQTAGKAIRIVYISRIDRKKGLDLLLEAVQLTSSPMVVDNKTRPRGYYKFAQSCRQLARAVAPHTAVSFKGELQRCEVRSTFTNYDLFAFPTAGQNFGHVIAESLSATTKLPEYPNGRSLGESGAVLLCAALVRRNHGIAGRHLAPALRSHSRAASRTSPSHRPPLSTHRMSRSFETGRGSDGRKNGIRSVVKPIDNCHVATYVSRFIATS